MPSPDPTAKTTVPMARRAPASGSPPPPDWSGQPTRIVTHRLPRPGPGPPRLLAAATTALRFRGLASRACESGGLDERVTHPNRTPNQIETGKPNCDARPASSRPRHCASAERAIDVPSAGRYIPYVESAALGPTHTNARVRLSRCGTSRAEAEGSRVDCPATAHRAHAAPRTSVSRCNDPLNGGVTIRCIRRILDLVRSSHGGAPRGSKIGSTPPRAMLSLEDDATAAVEIYEARPGEMGAGAVRPAGTRTPRSPRARASQLGHCPRSIGSGRRAGRWADRRPQRRVPSAAIPRSPCGHWRDARMPVGGDTGLGAGCRSRETRSRRVARAARARRTRWRRTVPGCVRVSPSAAGARWWSLLGTRRYRRRRRAERCSELPPSRCFWRASRCWRRTAAGCRRDGRSGTDPAHLVDGNAGPAARLTLTQFCASAVAGNASSRLSATLKRSKA